MKHIKLLTSVLTLALAGVFSARAADGLVRYNSQPGTNNLVQIDGTSTVHDWTVIGRLIGGYIEVGSDFPVDVTKAKPGPVTAGVSIYIPVRGLRSYKDGKPYSNQMDGIMWEKLLESKPEGKQIKYSLSEMVVKEAPSEAGKPVLFDTKGDLVVAGVTNRIEMPVSMTVDGKRLIFDATVGLKMTDFKIEPPAPALAGGLIKTGDEVKLTLRWCTITR